MQTEYEKTIKTQTTVRDAEGCEATVKHYFDGGVMITQEGGCCGDKVYISAEAYAEFIKAVTRVG